MNILVCDDLKSEAEKLSALLRDEGHEAAVFFSGADALEYIEGGGLADVCIFDIVMPEMSGVELAAELRKKGWGGRIVFLSTSNAYGSESYRVKATDYLIKPVTGKAARELLQRLLDAEKASDTNSVTLKAAGMIRTVLCRDISYAEVIDHNVVYHLTDGDSVEVYGSIADAQELLSGDGRFARCHRSFIVNMDEIKSITGYEIAMRQGAHIKISQSYTDIKKRYAKRLI